MNNILDKISYSQRKTIIICLVLLTSFILAWYLIYYPTKYKIKQLRSQLNENKRQIEQIESIVGGTSSIDGGVKLLVNQYRSFEDRFPQKEEEALGFLSDYARDLSIEVISVRASPKTPYLTKDQQPVKIDDKICQKSFVSIELSGKYIDMINFIEDIKYKLPAQISIERIKFLRTQQNNPILNISIGLNIYLLT